jgi:hypothetical protein
MACITITVAAMPANMVAGAFDVNPKTLQVGTTFTATQVVSNTGGSDGVATVNFTAGGVVQTKTATIPAGGTTTISATYTSSTPGSLVVCGELV